MWAELKKGVLRWAGEWKVQQNAFLRSQRNTVQVKASAICSLVGCLLLCAVIFASLWEAICFQHGTHTQKKERKKENMLGINWICTNQVFFIWPDSIKLNILHRTYVTKLRGKLVSIFEHKHIFEWNLSKHGMQDAYHKDQTYKKNHTGENIWSFHQWAMSK